MSCRQLSACSAAVLCVSCWDLPAAMAASCRKSWRQDACSRCCRMMVAGQLLLDESCDVAQCCTAAWLGMELSDSCQWLHPYRLTANGVLLVMYAGWLLSAWRCSAPCSPHDATMGQHGWHPCSCCLWLQQPANLWQTTTLRLPAAEWEVVE